MLRILFALFLLVLTSGAAAYAAEETDVQKLIILMAHNPPDGSLCNLSGRPSGDEMECTIGDTHYSVRYRRVEYESFFGRLHVVSRFPMLSIATERRTEGRIEFQLLVDKRADGVIDIGRAVSEPPWPVKRHDDGFMSRLGGCKPEKNPCGKQYERQWQELYDIMLAMLIAQLEKAQLGKN